MKKFIYISLILAICSCNSDRIYNEYQSFDESLWYKTDIKEFIVDIKENGNYIIEVSLRYIEGCPHKTLPININYVTPSGENLTLNHEFIIINENGDYQGGIAGSICDLENRLNNKVTFNEIGTYKFLIAQDLDRDPAMLIMEIGLLLEKEPVK